MATKSKTTVSRTKKPPTRKANIVPVPWRKYAPLIAIVVFAVVGTALLTLSFAAKGGKPREGTTTVSTSTSTITSISDLLALHTTLCPKVTTATNCSTLRVETPNRTDVTWTGYAHPAEGYVEYNTRYLGTYSASSWSNVIAHEVGGHMDTWNELVAKVGPSKAWTDYYDIDKLAEPFFEPRLGIDLTPQIAKEVYLDCQGTVRNGYIGAYLYNRGKRTLTEQQTVCSGYRTIFDQAVL